jgi:hypothetical protein
LAAIAFLLTQIRALKIGWTARDFIYFIIFISTLVTALNRRKFTSHFKAILLIIFNFIVGVFGVYTIEMLAGGIFFLPLAAVTIALFYSKRAVAVFGVLSILFLCFIMINFTWGNFTLKPDADFVLTNYLHWSVYILCFAFFFLVTCVTILNYRTAMGALIANIDGLVKTRSTACWLHLTHWNR